MTEAEIIARLEKAPKRMQCKDIPDLPILQFLANLNGRRGRWFSWIDSSTGAMVVPDNSTRHAMPDGPSLPDRLVLAKMASLIRKGLVDGCPCGCRGDYTLTDAGWRASLKESEMSRALKAENDNLQADPFMGLPSFASDDQIAVAIVGRTGAKHWKFAILPALERKGFPGKDTAHGGRPVPLVRRFYDAYLGITAGVAMAKPDGEERFGEWRKRKPKAA